MRKIAVYRFLIALLVSELLKFQELKTDQTNCTEVRAQPVTSCHGHFAGVNL